MIAAARRPVGRIGPGAGGGCGEFSVPCTALSLNETVPLEGVMMDEVGKESESKGGDMPAPLDRQSANAGSGGFHV